MARPAIFLLGSLLLATPAMAQSPPKPIDLHEAMREAFNLGLTLGQDVAREIAARDAKAKDLADFWARYTGKPGK